MGPNTLFVINCLYSRSDDLAKHAAATSKNGVVGSTGKTTPITAKATKIMPTTFKKNLLIFHFLKYAH